MPSSLPAAQEVSSDQRKPLQTKSRKRQPLPLSAAIIVSSLIILAAGYSTISFAQTRVFDGKWLHRVPDEDRARKNPFAHNPQAAEAGHQLFLANCAKCHAADANGRPNRPSLRTERIRHATDGELAWMLQHGDPYQGMPQWSSLPEDQRWQIIAFLRTLPPGHPRPSSRSGSSM